jgi:hypothetical protein
MRLARHAGFILVVRTVTNPFEIMTQHAGGTKLCPLYENRTNKLIRLNPFPIDLLFIKMTDCEKKYYLEEPCFNHYLSI